MKLKFSLLFLINFFISVNICCAQDAKVKWIVDEKEKFSPEYFVTTKDNKLIAFYNKTNSTKIKKFHIKIYNSAYKLVKEIEHKEWEHKAWKSKKYDLTTIKRFGDDIYMIVSLVDKQKVKIYANKLTDDYKASEKLTYIGEIDKTKNTVNGFNMALGVLSYGPTGAGLGVNVKYKGLYHANSKGFHKTCCLQICSKRQK